MKTMVRFTQSLWSSPSCCRRRQCRNKPHQALTSYPRPRIKITVTSIIPTFAAPFMSCKKPERNSKLLPTISADTAPTR